MARKSQSRLAVWSQYLALRAVASLMHCFDVDQNLRTAAGVGSLFGRMSRRHRLRAEGNIAMCYPDWPAQRVAEVAERSMQHMFQLFMVDAVITPRRITESSWPTHVRVGRLGGVLDRLIRGEPTIFITGHCGNWELLGYVLAVIGYPLYALARPLDNPLLDRWVMGIREARGMRIITKWGATPVLQDVLRSGGRVAFIADQNAGSQGLFVPFFGRLASSYKSIGLLAMRYEVPIVAGFARRLGGRFAYELSATDIIRPQDWKDRPDPLFYITARYNRAIELMIRTAPEQYLWVHRRWKSRPRHERLGRPVPRRLIENLRSLPWLTPQEVDRIVQGSNEAAIMASAGNRGGGSR
ncbi:MAG: lysophospholipid acyltransferase family protein [Planctomycetota bacterium]